MKADHILRYEAMELLLRKLGAVDAERFISMVKRDTFNYTEWRRGQWNEMTIEEIHVAAVEHARTHSK